MGEEEVKKTEEPKKVEEERKGAEPKPETTEKQPPPPSDDKKEDKKTEAAAAAAVPPPPPPPPQEIILKVYMHCEGCARKVRRCLKGFEGVEEVITDCRTSKVVVKGEKADPLKVLERVQKKSHRQVQLISPLPKPPVEEPKPEEEKQVAKTEDKKTEPPPVITVLLGVFMHCEACAQGIKKRIQRMKGVESAVPDLKNSQVTVKGVFEPEKLTDHVYKRCGKHAVIIKVEGEKKEEEKGKEESKEEKKEEKKAEGEGEGDKGEKEVKKVEEKKEGGEGGGGGEGGEGEAVTKPEVVEAEETKMELRRNEFYPYYPQIQSNYQVYPQRYVHQDIYAYPPQMFSDENPNACSVM